MLWSSSSSNQSRRPTPGFRLPGPSASLTPGRLHSSLRNIRLFQCLGFGLLAVLLMAGAARLRIAKITVNDISGPRTLFRVCWPGRAPDAFAMTDRDFSGQLYDCYGLRHLGGFGLATQGSANGPPVLFPASISTGRVDEISAIAIARRSVATNDARYPAWLGTEVSYRARSDGRGWSVVAERIVGTNDAGEPMFEIGGQRFISINENGVVTYYGRGH